MWRNENALILDKSLETAFDQGTFVLVPIDTRPDELTRWKVLLLDDSKRYKIVDPDLRSKYFLSHEFQACQS